MGVTCQHVLVDPAHKLPIGEKWASQAPRNAGRCCYCCNDIIGKIRYGAQTVVGVDAALIASSPKSSSTTGTGKGVIGAGKGVRPLTTADLGLPVRKYGLTTGFTEGTVLTVAQTVNLGGNTFVDGQITIRPVTGTPVWDCCLCKNGTGQCGGGNAENFSSFACAGDSGSAVVRCARKYRWFAGPGHLQRQGRSYRIDVVMAATGITVETATAAKQEQTVPSVSGVNAMGLEPEMAMAPVWISSDQQQALARAHAELLATPLGESCAEAIHKYQEEVLRLVNTNRRVATVWHRNGGPQIVASALEAVQLKTAVYPPRLLADRSRIACCGCKRHSRDMAARNSRRL